MKNRVTRALRTAIPTCRLEHIVPIMRKYHVPLATQNGPVFPFGLPGPPKAACIGQRQSMYYFLRQNCRTSPSIMGGKAFITPFVSRRCFFQVGYKTHPMSQQRHLSSQRQPQCRRSVLGWRSGSSCLLTAQDCFRDQTLRNSRRSHIPPINICNS